MGIVSATRSDLGDLGKNGCPSLRNRERSDWVEVRYGSSLAMNIDASLRRPGCYARGSVVLAHENRFPYH